MKRIQEEAATQHEQNSEKLKNAEEKVVKKASVNPGPSLCR